MEIQLRAFQTTLLDRGDLQMFQFPKKYVTPRPDRHNSVNLKFNCTRLFIYSFISFNYNLLLYNTCITQKEAKLF
jgi:hypothetical protein